MGHQIPKISVRPWRVPLRTANMHMFRLTSNLVESYGISALAFLWHTSLSHERFDAQLSCTVFTLKTTGHPGTMVTLNIVAA